MVNPPGSHDATTAAKSGGHAAAKPEAQPESAKTGQAPAASAKVTLQGAVFTPANDAERAEAIEKAFDYRGDVTINTSDGATHTGYIFDRRKDGPQAQLRLIPADGARVTIPYARIASIGFSGRDTASGRSWEAWVKKYHEKKAKGESASMEPASLDE